MAYEQMPMLSGLDTIRYTNYRNLTVGVETTENYNRVIKILCSHQGVKGGFYAFINNNNVLNHYSYYGTEITTYLLYVPKGLPFKVEYYDALRPAIALVEFT